MNILLIGKDLNTQTIARIFSSDPAVTKIFIASTEPMNFSEKCVTISINEHDTNSMAAFAKQNNISFTLPLSLTALQEGVADCFLEQGHPIIAPVKNHTIFQTDLIAAKRFYEEQQIPLADNDIAGEKFEYLCLVHGTQIIPLMPDIDADAEEIILTDFIVPIVAGLKKQGAPFSGFLNGKFIITPEGDLFFEGAEVLPTEAQMQWILGSLQGSLAQAFVELLAKKPVTELSFS